MVPQKKKKIVMTNHRSETILIFSLFYNNVTHMQISKFHFLKIHTTLIYIPLYYSNVTFNRNYSNISLIQIYYVNYIFEGKHSILINI